MTFVLGQREYTGLTLLPYLFVFKKICVQLKLNLIVQKRATEGGKQGASLKKLKKDKVAGVAAKATRAEGNTVSVAPRVKPELTLPAMYFLFPVAFIYRGCLYLK